MITILNRSKTLAPIPNRYQIIRVHMKSIYQEIISLTIYTFSPYIFTHRLYSNVVISMDRIIPFSFLKYKRRQRRRSNQWIFIPPIVFRRKDTYIQTDQTMTMRYFIFYPSHSFLEINQSINHMKQENVSTWSMKTKAMKRKKNHGQT